MMMSTRPDISVGMRLGVVTHVRLTLVLLPNASCAKRRAILTSYPSFLPRTSMKPNGGKSHLMPISHRFLLFTRLGSGGRFGFAAGFFFGLAARPAPALLPAGDAAPQAVKTAPASRSAARTIAIRLIQLLLHRW